MPQSRPDQVDENGLAPGPDPSADPPGKAGADLRRQLEERVEKRLKLLKEQIALRKEVEVELRQESARVKLLQQVAVAANEAQSTEEMLQRALAHIAAHLDWPFGHVYLPAPEQNGTLVPADIWYCTDEERFAGFIQRTKATSFTIGEGWLGQAAAKQMPTHSPDLSQEPTFVRRGDREDLGVKAGFALPILAEDELAIVLEFFSATEIALEANLLDLMSHIGAQLGRAIERQRAQARLARGEMLLAQAERIAHLGSWRWDLAASSVVWSDEMCRIFGIRPEEFTATFEDFLSRVHRDDRQRVANLIQSSVAQKKPFRFHHRIVRPDGEVIILHGQGRPELDDEGKVIRYFGTGQDVTEEVRLQQKLVRHAETLQALEQMGHAVTSTFDRKVIFQEVLAKLMDLLGAQGVFVLLLQGDELIFAAGNQAGADDPTGRRIPASSGVAGQVLATGQSQALFGEEARKRTFEDFVRALGYRPGALLVAPLRLRGNLIGALEAMHQRADGFTEEDLPILEAAASWTAIAVQNAGLVRQLNVNRDRSRQLARQVVTAQEQERRRISRELHDEAGQALTALKISLGMIQASLASEQPDIARQLGEAIETTDYTMEQIRRLAHGLHPPVLDKLGLEAAAEGLCADLAARTNLDIRAQIATLPPLDDQSGISLYRVLQEALTNTVRHAEASKVIVTLAQVENALVLTVVDDGRGFETVEQITSVHSGLGIAGMQERIELLGGQLHIDSAPGQGTRIAAHIPCPQKKGEA